MENVVTFSHFCATTFSCLYCLSPLVSLHLNGLVDVTKNNLLKSKSTSEKTNYSLTPQFPQFQ